MLLTICFPFYDFRALTDPQFERILTDRWGMVDAAHGHLRHVGRFAARPKRGFEDWVGENVLVYGNNRVCLKLFRSYSQCGVINVRLVRKACYFDGLLNGRFEFLFHLEKQSTADYAAVARTFLDIPASTRDGRFVGPIRNLHAPLRYLWSSSTVRRGHDPCVAKVEVGNPVSIIEDDRPPGAGDTDDPMRLDAKVLRIDNRSFDMFTLLAAPEGGSNDPRYLSRYVRTYQLRLIQDLAAIGALLGERFGVALDSDTTQAVLREYFRHINRSQQRLTERVHEEVIDYCFTAFELLIPGGIEQARKRLATSAIRRQVKDNILGLVERAIYAHNYFEKVEKVGGIGHMIENVTNNTAGGDIVGGDKFLGDKVGRNKTGDISGAAVNLGDNSATSATQTVSNVGLVNDIREFARAVREADQADAELDADLVEKAAEALQKGDEDQAKSRLQRCGEWVFDLATKVGSTALVAFLTAKGLIA